MISTGLHQSSMKFKISHLISQLIHKNQKPKGKWNIKHKAENVAKAIAKENFKLHFTYLPA